MFIEVESVLLTVLELQEVVVEGLLGYLDMLGGIVETDLFVLACRLVKLSRGIEFAPSLDRENDLADLAFLSSPGPLRKFCLAIDESIRVLSLGSLPEFQFNHILSVASLPY